MNPLKEMKVTSPFGPREAPIKGASTFHSGVDLKATIGAECFAENKGTVKIVSEYSKGIGKYIVIEHDNHCTTYGHLDAFKVKQGQTVSEGQLIALTGNTGNSQAPHLHFEVRIGQYNKDYWTKPVGTYYKNAVDPIEFLERKPTRELSFGSKGTDVLRIHNLLKKDGFNIIPDGDFGDYTRSIVKQFQKRYGLKVDGLVGPASQKVFSEIESRAFTINYYDKQSYYIVYPKSEIDYIDIVRAPGLGQTPMATIKTIFNSLKSKFDTVTNATMYNMTTGSPFAEFFDEGKRYGYNPYDPLTFTIRQNGQMAFMDEADSRKLTGLKDCVSFAPQMFDNGKKSKYYGRNLSVSFLTKNKEPRHGWFETKDNYVQLIVNGRQPLKGFYGVTIPQMFTMMNEIALRIGQPILNGGNFDGGYSLGQYIMNVFRSDTGVISRKIPNILGIKTKRR